MIKNALIAVQNALKTLPALRYIAEDWGQLNSLEMQPAQFPCALIDFSEADYTSIGANMQNTNATLVVRVVQVQTQNSSNAPNANVNFESYDLVTDVNKVLHGLGSEHFTPLCRVSMARVTRDDVLKEIVITYKFGFCDESTSTAKEYRSL